jgi:hypothetical protein
MIEIIPAPEIAFECCQFRKHEMMKDGNVFIKIKDLFLIPLLICSNFARSLKIALKVELTMVYKIPKKQSHPAEVPGIDPAIPNNVLPATVFHQTVAYSHREFSCKHYRY